MASLKTYYRSRLPHYQPIGATFFVTFRLAGSLPVSVIMKLKEKFERIDQDPFALSMDKEWAKIQLSGYFHHFDEELDRAEVDTIRLNQDSVARLITQKLKEYDGYYYQLVAFVIMPNHVHLLLDFSCQISDENGLIGQEVPSVYKQLHQVMKLIKGGTAFQINKLLDRTGQVWARESYDRVIRNSNERGNVIRYILNNPVKAKLVKRWDEWPYTFVLEG